MAADIVWRECCCLPKLSSIKGATKQTQIPLEEWVQQDAGLQILCFLLQPVSTHVHANAWIHFGTSMGSHSGSRLVAREHIGISSQLPDPVLINILPKH